MRAAGHTERVVGRDVPVEHEPVVVGVGDVTPELGLRAAGGRRQLRWQPGSSYVRMPFADLAERTVRLRDLMGPASYDRDGDDLVARGLYQEHRNDGFD